MGYYANQPLMVVIKVAWFHTLCCSVSVCTGCVFTCVYLCVFLLHVFLRVDREQVGAHEFRGAASLLMATDTVKRPINLKLSRDERGVRHVGGQRGGDGRRKGRRRRRRRSRADQPLSR